MRTGACFNFLFVEIVRLLRFFGNCQSRFIFKSGKKFALPCLRIHSGVKSSNYVAAENEIFVFDRKEVQAYFIVGYCCLYTLKFISIYHSRFNCSNIMCRVNTTRIWHDLHIEFERSQLCKNRGYTFLFRVYA